jgi:hypothetical protein
VSNLNPDQYTRHLPPESKSLLRAGAPTPGCHDCTTYAEQNAVENGAEYGDESEKWAKMYVEEGMTSPCTNCVTAAEVSKAPSRHEDWQW